MWLLTSVASPGRRQDLGKLPWLLPQEEFRRVVMRERARSDRSAQPFAVVVFDASRSSAAELRTLLQTLKERRRLTDDVGWWSEPAEVAVLLADTPQQGAFKYCTEIHRRLREAGVDVGSRMYAYRGTGGALEAVSGGEGRRASDREGEGVAQDVARADTLDLPGSPGVGSGEATPSVSDLGELFVEPLPAWKRALDIVGSVAALVVFSPLFAGIAVALKLSSPRAPVIFKQPRAGLGGRPFMFYKFRTMVPDAEALKESLRPYSEVSGPVFKMKNDPRVTRLGRFLRRTSLDEIPQLWNVLKGDMSLVGPRPPTLDEVSKYESWQRRRLEVTGGITGFWQVSGRHEIPFVEWMRLDIRYASKRSLWTDLKVLAKTVLAVIDGRGAA